MSIYDSKKDNTIQPAALLANGSSSIKTAKCMQRHDIYFLATVIVLQYCQLTSVVAQGSAYP